MKLILFTSSFPYGKGEQFIETEIRFLSEHFDEIFIYPLDCDGARRELPSNVRVERFKLYAPYSRMKMLLRRGIQLFRWYSKEIKTTHHPEKYSGQFSYHFNYLMHRMGDAERLSAELNKYPAGEAIVYSYWFNIWVTALLLGSAARLHKFKIVSRAHGGDLDESQKKSGYFPFRTLEMHMIDRVFCVSEYGRDLLRVNQPLNQHKAEVSYLGVDTYGDNIGSDDGVFRIVSCSFVYALKRLHLLIEVLSHIRITVEWVHFGDGELMEEIKSLAGKLPANIHVVFRGHVANRDIIDHYRLKPVDLFMNVSELEGIPVSIMEAISFGIPVTGCRICGVPEIVTEQSGFLLEKDFSPASVAHTIEQYAESSGEHKLKFRRGVKDFWKHHFNAEANYPDFIRRLKAAAFNS